MDEPLDKELERFTWEFQEEKVDILALKNFGPVDIDKVHLNLVRGKITSVPLWVAEILQEEEIVQINGFEEVNFAFLLKLAYDETKSERLTELGIPMFIEKVKNEIKRLENNPNKNSPNINTMQKQTSVRGSFNTIIRYRFKKILKYMQGTSSPIKNKRILTTEEEWLYGKLRDLFEIWMNLAEIEAKDE